MVRGLDRFRTGLGAFTNQYVLIGGAACELLMDEAGLPFRATKDLDIVLCVEELDVQFVRAFWAFVRSGKYAVQQSATGKTRYYRFMKPEDEEYPFMLELFSSKPAGLDLAEGSHLTPISMDGDVSSLSAILLDDSYYAFLRSGRRVLAGLSLVDPEHLVPLKARAWLDLTARSNSGEAIDGKSIAKHKNDVFRLSRLLDPTITVGIPDVIREDMGAFLDAMKSESIDLRALGLQGQKLDSILDELRRLYVGV